MLTPVYRSLLITLLGAIVIGCAAPAESGAKLSVSGSTERMEAFERAAQDCGLTNVTRDVANGISTVSALAPANGTREYQCAIGWLSEHPETFLVQPRTPVAPSVIGAPE